jgi:hypothetical protein
MIITATPNKAATPPSVRLDVSAIPAGAVTTTISRAVPGLPSTAVRGAQAVAVQGTVTGTVDYEAPFGVSTVYTVTAYGSSGAVVGTPAQVSTLLDVDVMWVSDPLAPVVSCACRGVKSPESFANLTYSLTTAVTPIEGQELPVGLSGVRQAASGVPLTIICETQAEAGPIRQVLRYASPFLLRTPIRWQVPLPALSYCLVGQVSEALFGGLYGRTHFSMTFDLVQAPGQTQAVLPRTYSTLLVEASTYGDLTTQHTSYLGVLLGGV